MSLVQLHRIIILGANAQGKGGSAANLFLPSSEIARRRILYLLFSAMLISVPLGHAVGSGGPRALSLSPPTWGAYHAAFPDFGGPEDNVTADKITDFESLVQKKIVWAFFSNNWLEGIRFPEASVRVIHDQGVIPFIRMMARSSLERQLPDPVYTMQRIIDGDFDQDLHAWAQRAKQVGIPLIVEFGTEVNGNWFPWNGQYNGGGNTKGYGDPTLPDGPERFRDAYRHIINICRAEGATDITWVFHVNYDSVPMEPWNTMAAYYPGDDYIDWIGISTYGAQRPGEEWHLFSEIMDTAYLELAAISSEKPLAVLEYGVVDDPATGNKASWIYDALQSVRNGRYPRIKAMSYWHENWENDDGTISNLRLDSSPEALAAYREEVAHPFFLGELAPVTTIHTSTTFSSSVPTTQEIVATTRSTTEAPAIQPATDLFSALGIIIVLAAVGVIAMLFWKKRRSG